MTNEKPKPVFLWLLVLDSVITVAAVLVWQSLTVGFDPIFYNPVLVAVSALLSMAIGSFFPFLILYRVVFEVIEKRAKISPAALCWALFFGLTVITVTLNAVSFGADLSLFDAAIPIALASVNVTIFYWRRVKGLAGGAAAADFDSAR